MCSNNKFVFQFLPFCRATTFTNKISFLSAILILQKIRTTDLILFAGWIWACDAGQQFLGNAVLQHRNNFLVTNNSFRDCDEWSGLLKYRNAVLV